MQTKVKKDDQNLVSDAERITYRMLKEKAYVSMSELGKTLNIDARQVRRLIELMRMKGIRIGSGNKGYNLIQSDEEYAKFEKRYTSGAFNRLVIAKAMRDNNEGQVFIDE